MDRLTGTTPRGVAGSVQLAVLSAPTTTITDAVAEVRRRLASNAEPPVRPVLTPIPRSTAAAAA